MGNFILGFILGSRPATIIQISVGIVILAIIVGLGSDGHLGTFDNFIALAKAVFWGFVLLCVAGFATRFLDFFKPIREAAVRRREGTAELSNQHFIQRVLEGAMADLVAEEPAEFELMEETTEPGSNVSCFIFKLSSPSLTKLEDRTGQFYGAAFHGHSDRDAGFVISFRRAKDGVDTVVSSKRSASIQEITNFVSQETAKIVNVERRKQNPEEYDLHSQAKTRNADGSVTREYMGH